jgi:hypothetical protein
MPAIYAIYKKVANKLKRHKAKFEKQKFETWKQKFETKVRI